MVRGKHCVAGRRQAKGSASSDSAPFGIAIRRIDRGHQHAVDRGFDVAALSVGGIAREARPGQDRRQGILICDIELGRSHFTCEETDEIHPISEQATDADGRLVHRRFSQEQAA
jgi:hypothetical protein